MNPNDKAERLAAIRAANAAKKPAAGVETSNSATPAPTVTPPNNIEADLLDEVVALAWPNALLVLSAVAFGALLAVWAMPLLLPSLSDSLQGEQPHVYWLLSRSSGLVAYCLVWLSMMMGLLLSGRAAALFGPATVLSIHQHTGLLGLAFGIFHALILLGDQYIGFEVGAIFIPFQTDYRPLWVAFGQIAWYAMLVVQTSFYLRPWIGRKVWRTIHYLSFVMFILSLGHGILSGSDSEIPLIRWLYWGSGGSVLYLLIYRILATRKLPKAAVRVKQGA